MILIGNGRVITRDIQDPVIENGCVAISEVGYTARLTKEYPKAEFIDARGGLIMPGFINAHHHIYSAFARGMSVRGYSPKNFSDILSGLWWKLDSKLTLEDIKFSAYTTLIDGIKNGVTTVFDHHAGYLPGAVSGSLSTLAEAAKTLGVRACLCFEVSDRNGSALMKQAVEENETFIKANERGEMLSGVMGLHASFTLSDKTMDYCKAHTPDYAGFHIHVAEGMADVQDSLKKYGKRIVDRLFDLEMLGRNTIAAHCVHVDGREMELLANTGTFVPHNPESNMGNAVGCGAIPQMFNKGVRLGMGTDGYTSDMLESLKVCNIIHKHNCCDPTVGFNEACTMLFENNAKLASEKFHQTIGVLQPGAAADVIVADYDPITPLTEDNVNGHIMFGVSGRSVSTTIINGRIAMIDRVLVGIDEREMCVRAREAADGLWQRINA